MGKGTTHENLMAIIHSKNSDWTKLGFYIFDIPSSYGEYEQRMSEMEAQKPFLARHIHIVENIKCGGIVHLHEFVDSVVAAKGEGIILREPSSKYIPGRTTSILKVKGCYLKSTLNISEI